MSALDVEESRFFYVLQDSIRILLVDDDPILREFGIVHLSTEAAEVETAADGVEALEVLARAPIDLTVDVTLSPEASGRATIRVGAGGLPKGAQVRQLADGDVTVVRRTECFLHRLDLEVEVIAKLGREVEASQMRAPGEGLKQG